MQNSVDKIISQIIKIAKFISSQAELSFEERAATILQYHVLSYLSDNPNAKLSDIAKHLHSSLSSTTQLIERMHKSAFVVRSADENDRRIIRHSITEEGKKRLDQMKEAKRERMKILLAKLDKDEINAFINIQEKLLKDL